MYIPDIGEIVWLEFNPQAGHEHRGHRPALVLSPQKYNQKTNLMICCPMTTKVKGYPFEVVIKEKNGQSVAILSDQVKSLDWAVRKAKPKGKVNHDVLQQVKNKISLLLNL